MKQIIINGLPLDSFSGRVVNNGEFYLKTKALLPPEGFSLERLAFFICAVVPLFEFFFTTQHFEGEYSIWVRRKLKTLPAQDRLALPDKEAADIFMKNVAFLPQIERFLRAAVPDISLEGYISMAGYRAEKFRFKALEKEPYKGQRGKELISGLAQHRFTFKPGEAYGLWQKFLPVPGRLGDDLREAFLEGRYQLAFSAAEFMEFIFALDSCPGLNARLTGIIYNGLALRSGLFNNDEGARRLGRLFAGHLRAHAAEYAALPKNIDLLSVFTLEDPSRMRKLLEDISGDMEAGWKDFFYIADYGPSEDRDFEGFDEKLDQSVTFISQQYQNAETLPDLWEDKYFKFIYLMCALWFKHCYNEQGA